MKKDFASKKSPWNNLRLVRKVLILAVLVACTALISSESPAGAARISCYEAQTDFTNAGWGYSEAYQLTQGNPTTCADVCQNHPDPPTCISNCQTTRMTNYMQAESTLFGASAALAGTCSMEQPEFCPGAYERASQCSAQWDYSYIEDPEYAAYVYNQYQACVQASGINSCV